MYTICGACQDKRVEQTKELNAQIDFVLPGLNARTVARPRGAVREVTLLPGPAVRV